jgi:hypothetical protein
VEAATNFKGAVGSQGIQGEPGVVSADLPLSYDAGTRNISIDLSSYDTSTEVDTKLSSYDTSTEVDTKLSDYDTTVAVDAKLSGYDTSSEVTDKINAIVDAAPGTLDTLNELAAALGNDENFSTTITNAISVNTTDIATNVTAIDQRKIEITSSVGSSLSCAAGYRYITTVTSGITLTLPASPSAGDEVQVLDGTGAATSILVARNGNLINGLSEDADLDVAGFAVVFIYTGATFGWRLG